MLPLWDLEEHRRAPAATLWLGAALVVVFGFELFLFAEGPGRLESWIAAHAVVAREWVAHWDRSEVWVDMLTAMFLHAGVPHLAGNVWFLWVFGRSVESRIRFLPFLVLYGLCGVVASLSQIAADPRSAVPMLGASGAISGILGAYLRLLPRAWVVTLVPWVVPIVPLPALVFLVVWFGLQLVQGVGDLLQESGVAGGVAWWAHAGGFVTGLLLAGPFSTRRGARRGRARRRAAKG